MSQNDFSIANANGATVRADINSALQALASLSGGSSAPGTTYANQWWFDTTNDILKIRDEANANWVNAFSLVGTTWIPYSNGAVLGTMANLAYAGINQNLVMSSKHVAFASTSVSSGTPDFATSGNVVTLSSTATANTLGTVQAGFIGVIHYGVAITITHNGTSRILPTAANVATAVGDVEIVMSLGSGNWRTISYMRASGEALVGTAASQAQMEAASSNLVFATPGRFHFHPGSAKARVKYNQESGTAVEGGVSYNLSSLTDGTAGIATMNFTTSFSSADYHPAGCSQRPSTNSDSVFSIYFGTDPTASAFVIGTTIAATAADMSYVSCVIHGDM